MMYMLVFWDLINIVIKNISNNEQVFVCALYYIDGLVQERRKSSALYPSHTGRRPRCDLQNRPDRRWSPLGRCEIS